MQIGVGLPNTVPEADGELIMTWARRSDEGPFSCLGVLDRLVYDSYESLTTLAAAAGITNRIRLASTIVIAPLRSTALLAKEAATIDVLSGGRLTLGVAVGARKDDYDLGEGDYGSRGSRLDKQLKTLRTHWKEGTLGPKPVQSNGPQLLVGGLHDAAFARMARYADGHISGGGPPKAFARNAEKARAAWSDAGREGQPALWGMGYYALGGTAETEAGTNNLLDYYAFAGPFAEKIASGLLTSPEVIRELIRGYEEAGCDELLFFPTVANIVQLDRLAEVIA
ncbi:LLM class flavin-dependent oxidoreductase [Acidobacteria bacterium AH-259-D05]|nr:LLM class flavin-dependent oxidoreductase [Acidobacteria bacterium AH-259-D05]